MAWFSVKFIHEGDIKKVFVCSEPNQKAGDFVIQCCDREISKLLKIDGFKSDPEDETRRENAMLVPKDMPMDAVAAFGVRYLVVHCEVDANTAPESTLRSAFDVLRDVNRTYDWLPPSK